MEKLIFGFAGEMKAGKGTATGLVKGWYPGTPSVRFSDPLREFLFAFNVVKSWGVFESAKYSFDDLRHLQNGLSNIFPREIIGSVYWSQLSRFYTGLIAKWLSYSGEVNADRPNLQALSTALRSVFAENILERTVMERIAGISSESPIAIVDGIRRLVDIGMLLTKPNFRLIYLEIDPVVAYQRMRKQNENVGDAEMQWERFLELREAEAEQQIRLLKPHAHLVIDNSGEPVVLETVLRAEVAKWLVS